MSTPFTVSVPGSTSNIGPGYDVFGLALNIRNAFRVTALRKGATNAIAFAGPEAKGLEPSPDNMFFQAAATVFVRARRAPVPMMVEVTVNVPNARGLGSSSTAAVAGIVAANRVLGDRFAREALLELACAFEGHPDNVAPALCGGLTAAVIDPRGPVQLLRVRPSSKLAFVVISPNYEVKTADARAVLPKQVPMKDAVANASRLPLLFEALRRGTTDGLPLLTQDCLHEPYRAPLYPGHPELRGAALKAGAAAVCVSGAGPSLFCIATKDSAAKVVGACERALARTSFGGKVRLLAPDGRGATIR